MWTKIKLLQTKWKVLIPIIITMIIWIGVSDTNKRNEREYCEKIANKAETAFSEGYFYEAEDYYTELVNHNPTCPNRPFTSDGYVSRQ